MRKTKRKSSGSPRRVRAPRTAVEIIDSVWDKKPGFRERVEEVRTVRIVGDLIREARKAHGITQTELARRIGSSQSAIARIEDADYTAFKLSTIQRIAAALSRRVEIRLAPIKEKVRV